MKILEQIRTVRECKNLSQEDMAERMDMTVSGYGKLERGETKMYVETLVKIAQALDIDLKDLLAVEGKAPIYIKDSQISHSPILNEQMSNYNYYSNYYYVVGDEKIEHLTEQLKHQNELLIEKQMLIQQQAQQLKMAQEMIELLKNQSKSVQAA